MSESSPALMIKVFKDEEDDWIAAIVGREGLSAVGETRSKAVHELSVVLEMLEEIELRDAKQAAQDAFRAEQKAASEVAHSRGCEAYSKAMRGEE